MRNWILCSEKMPEMHEARLLKEFGVKMQSDKVLTTIKGIKDGKRIVDNDCELRDGKWHSNKIEWLQAAKIEYEVIAWMPMPEPYRG